MWVLNNREIANGIWFIILSLWVLSNADTRNSLRRCINAFCNKKIISTVLLMILYTGLIFIIFIRTKFATIENLKETIYWFITGAFVLVLNTGEMKKDLTFVKNILKTNFTIMIFLEFIVNLKIYTLFTELLLVPFATFLLLLGITPQKNPETTKISKIANTIQAILGLIIFALAFKYVSKNSGQLLNYTAIKNILLIPLLNISFIPFLFILLIYSKYDSLFIKIKFGTKKNPKIIAYAKKQIVCFAKFNLNRLNLLLSDHASDIMHFNSYDDIDKCIRKAKTKLNK